MKLSKKKKIIIGAAAVVVILGGLKIATGKSGGNDLGMPVSTALTQKQDLEEILKLRAVLEGTESTEVVSRLHYEVKELNVKEGDHVTAGQLLTVRIFHRSFPSNAAMFPFCRSSRRKHWRTDRSNMTTRKRNMTT